MTTLRWSEVQVGTFVKLTRDQPVPADLLLVFASPGRCQKGGVVCFMKHELGIMNGRGRRIFWPSFFHDL